MDSFFANILTYLCIKITNINGKKKGAQNTFAQKASNIILMKLTPVGT
jgi:hypothetical protein